MSSTLPPTPAARSRSGALFEEARAVLPSGYTRHLAVTKPHPTYADYGSGCRVVTIDGQVMIDYINNFTAIIHGHGKREILDTINTQASRLMSTILPTEWEVRLAELLVDRIPGVERVRFANSGTEAVMIAIKVARAYTQRTKVAKMEGGYHGQFDLIEASFQPRPDLWGPVDRPTVVPHNVGTPQSLLDELILLPLNDIERTRQRLRQEAGDLAAVIVDPFRLQLGMVEPHADYLAMLREETARLGIVLIFDEVVSLRLGYHGAQGILGITPDLTTMGKIIGGGLPIGAIGGTAALMSVFEIERGEPLVKHSGTFTGNPLSLATGHTAMSLLTREAFDDLEAKGARLRDGLERVRHDLGIVGRVEGRGSVSSLHLSELQPTNYRELSAMMTPEYQARLAAYQKLLLAEGLLTMRALFVGSTPMTNDDIDLTIEGVRRALTALARN